MRSRKELRQKRERRKRRVRGGIAGTADRPRLSVFRSNRGMFVQLINDVTGSTIASVSVHELSGKVTKTTKQETARKMGTVIAERARAAGVTKAVLDRGSYQYHGRVQALARGAREAGLSL